MNTETGQGGAATVEVPSMRLNKINSKSTNTNPGTEIPQRSKAMNAIEVKGIAKDFRKWESKKKAKNGVSHNGNGTAEHTNWFSRHVPKRKTISALEAVSFEVKPGEIFGLLGPNGSGKSTLIRILSTLLIPDRGEVRVFGNDATRDVYKVQRLINRVSVDAAFFKKLSAHENLMYTARLYGIPASEAPKLAQDILEKIGFDLERYRDPLEEFSRGMQQKVAIARALLTSPIVLLLDEPTTGLDPKSKREVQAFIEKVRDNHEATIILTTHDMEEADRLCNRIGVIDKGKIIALDTPDGLKSMVLKDLAGSVSNVHGKDKVMTIEDITLEDVFLHLTGEALKKKEDDVE